MVRTSNFIISSVVLIYVIHPSEGNFLRAIFNRGKTILSENNWYPISNNKILSKMHHDNEQHNEDSYEKPTHRETDYGEEDGNIYPAKYHQVFLQQHHNQNQPQSYWSNKNQQEEHYGKIVYSQTKYPSILNFYTILGGLSFASLLATALIVLSRRNGSLFRTLEDDELYKRRGNNEIGKWKTSYNLFNMIEYPKLMWWEKVSRTKKR